MKITPLEIRQKDFEKKLRGYSKEDVDAFLQSLSYEWERLQTDHKDTKRKLEEALIDVRKLREVESSLYKTLKTAEDTGANVVDQAKKSAALQLREAQMNAESMMNDAKVQAKDIIDEAEDLVRSTVTNMRDELKSLENEFRMLENMRDNIILELKNISNDTLDRITRINTSKKTFNFKAPEIISSTLENRPKTKSNYATTSTSNILTDEPKKIETIEAEKPNEIQFEVNTSYSSPQNNKIEETEEEEEEEEVEEEVEMTLEIKREELDPIKDLEENKKKTNEEDSSFFDQI